MLDVAGPRSAQTKMGGRRKLYMMHKDSNFSMAEKQINSKDLKDNRPVPIKPSTTINIEDKSSKKFQKIKLRKNSFSRNILQPNEITRGLSDFTKSYIPDFGYTNQLDFDRTHGWQFLLDFVSKYPKREKTANMIFSLNKAKEKLVFAKQFICFRMNLKTKLSRIKISLSKFVSHHSHVKPIKFLTESLDLLASQKSQN